MKMAFSWDDGAYQDQRLFELHEKYDIPGMFFVPTNNREGRKVLTPSMIRSAKSDLISFGGHTKNHVYLTQIPISSVEEEVLSNKYYLEDILGQEVSDFCLPGGMYNKSILKIVYQHYKTIRTADTMCFKYSSGPLKPSFHVYPRGKVSLIGNSVRNLSIRELAYVIRNRSHNYFDIVRELLEYESKFQDSSVMIWGHSWEIAELNLWKELEKLMQEARGIGICKYSSMFEKK